MGEGSSVFRQPESPLVGRTSELAQITERPAAWRLLTIVGPPGVGKTRLAVEAARELSATTEEQSRLVELASVDAAAGSDAVGRAVAAGLGLPISAGVELVDTLSLSIGATDLLVVIDNAEHVLDDAAVIVKAMLERLPGLRILATRREPLGMAGEVVLRLDPLAIPEGSDFGAAGAAASVQLFCQRARRVDPGFQLTELNFSSIAGICRQLGGLPLAIELAATRMSVMTPKQVANRLALAVLPSASRDVETRHETMHAAIAWSYDLLTPDERLLFRRLVVFVDGWTMAAAEQVCSDDRLPREIVGATLQSLVDRSLILCATGRAGVRYSYLPAIREFAGRHWNVALAESGDVVDRHLQWCVELAEAAESGLTGSRRALWLRELDAEIGNLDSGLRNAAASGGGVTLLRLATALAGYFPARGRSTYGLRWLAQAENADDGRSPIRLVARARWAYWHLALDAAELEGCELAMRQSVALSERSGDQGLHARSLLTLGSCYLRDRARRDEACDVLERSRRLAAPAGDWWCLVNAVAGLGWARMNEGRLASARSLLEDAAVTARAHDEEAGLGVVLPLLGLVALRQGQPERAEEVAGEALACGEELEDPQLTARALAVLAGAAWRSGDLPAARKQATRAADLCRHAGLRDDLIDHLHLLGDLALAHADIVDARRRYTEAIGLAEQAGGDCLAAVLGLGQAALAAGEPWAARAFFEQILTGKARHDHAELAPDALIGLGRVLSGLGRPDLAALRFGEALAAARDRPGSPAVSDCLRRLAGASAEAGRPLQAARLSGAASGLDRAREGVAGRGVDQTAAGDAGSAEELAVAWAAGEAMSPDDAVDLGLAEAQALSQPESGWEQLTDNERSVVRLAAEQLTNVEIGERLFLSKGMVKIHLLRAFPKLGVSSRRELAAILRRLPTGGETDQGRG